MLSNPSIESEGEIGVNRRWLEFAPLPRYLDRWKNLEMELFIYTRFDWERKLFSSFFLFDEEEERDEINGFSSREWITSIIRANRSTKAFNRWINIEKRLGNSCLICINRKFDVPPGRRCLPAKTLPNFWLRASLDWMNTYRARWPFAKDKYELVISLKRSATNLTVFIIALECAIKFSKPSSDISFQYFINPLIEPQILFQNFLKKKTTRLISLSFSKIYYLSKKLKNTSLNIPQKNFTPQIQIQIQIHPPSPIHPFSPIAPTWSVTDDKQPPSKPTLAVSSEGVSRFQSQTAV